VLAPHLIVFDLAGTLLDDGGAVLGALRIALSRSGIQVEEDELNAMRGANKLHVLRSFAIRSLGPGPEALQAAHEGFSTFHEELAVRVRDGDIDLISGVPETLELLRGAGLKLATNSGFDRTIAEATLNRFRRSIGAFDADVCGDDVPEGRPAPYMIHLAMERAGIHDVRRVVVVGDTPLDLQAGTNAGAAGVVGVLTGTHDWRSLGAVRHTHLIPSVAALPALLRTEFEIDVSDPVAPSSD
jgi:phosphonatase-like hydrolase